MSRAGGVAIVLGTRPEAIKNWAIVDALRQTGSRYRILHTHQHALPRLHAELFRDLGYAPHEVMETPYTLGRAIDWVRDVVLREGLDTVLVNGDTAAALAGAIAALYSDRRLVHVEAGLRSFCPHMYEERNRIAVDAMANLLLAYTEREATHLRANREVRGRVAVVGNTTVDFIERFRERWTPPRTAPFLLVTMHRKEFTDCRGRMRTVFAGLRALAEETAVVLPMHPRTVDAMQRHGIQREHLGGVEVVDPLGPFDALAHIAHAELVLTDSGCVQEEACILGTPCVTVRDNTERQVTIEIGANALSGFDTASILQLAAQQRARPRGSWAHPYGLPGAGKRIVAALDSGAS